MSYLTLLLYFSLILDFQTPGETNIAGVYKGRPIFIQNPYNPDSRQFCISEVHVNNQKVQINPRMSAIKLDFNGIDLYAPVVVKITHKDSCNPVIINPDAIFFHSIFSFDHIAVTDSTIIWETVGEKKSGQFTIEKITNGLWMEVSTLEAKGVFGGASYTYNHQIDEGSYKFRIKYHFPDGNHLYSHEIDFHVYPDPVTFEPKKTSGIITFSRPAFYQIYDAGGAEVLSGTAGSVDISKLPKGDYVIYFNGDDPGLFTRQ